MRNLLIVLSMLLCSIASAAAQVSVRIGLPAVSIGVDLHDYPELVAVPGYPVYYAPQVASNYFFYDGMYWVYQHDNWYASTWYNGPWELVSPDTVPLFILRVPVRYYREAPAYFRGWASDAPPRWGDHWGNEWEKRRGGWENWNRSAAPALAPLPIYQRQYSGNRYPRVEQQQVLQSQNYRYRPRDAVVQQHYQTQQPQGVAQRQAQQPARPAAHSQVQQASEGPVQRQAPQRPQPVQQNQGQRPQRAVAQQQVQQPPQAAVQLQRQQPGPRPAAQGPAQQRPQQAAQQRAQQPLEATGQNPPQAAAHNHAQQPPLAAAQREKQVPKPGQEKREQ